MIALFNMQSIQARCYAASPSPAPVPKSSPSLTATTHVSPQPMCPHNPSVSTQRGLFHHGVMLR